MKKYYKESILNKFGFILILLTLFLVSVSCGTETKKEIKKSDDEIVSTIITTACEKIVNCNIGGEENVELAIAKYRSFYYSTQEGVYAYYMPIGAPIKKYLECINDNIDCLGYQECYNQLMGITYGENCNDNSIECIDDSVKKCVDGIIQYTDCSVVNKKCLAYSNKAICSNSKICDKNNFENYCNENGSLVYCNSSGYEEEYYCPYYGKECRTENNTVNCYLKEEQKNCENNNETYCKDENLTSCKENIELTTPCSLFGDKFICMEFTYPSGDFMKNVYGCFYEEKEE